MSARFEIVRTDADQPWHARFRAWNGRIQWSTENYTRRRGAERAVLSICNMEGFYISDYQAHPEVYWGGGDLLEVREVDERGAS